MSKLKLNGAAHHVVEQQAGGRPVVALRVLHTPAREYSLPPEWDFREDVPKTRGDCPETRPCPHIKCRYHLWFMEGESLPGRRRETAQPASSIRVRGSETCALDVAERKLAPSEVAKLLGISDRQLRRTTRAALRKLENDPDAREVLERLGWRL